MYKIFELDKEINPNSDINLDLRLGEYEPYDGDYDDMLEEIKGSFVAVRGYNRLQHARDRAASYEVDVSGIELYGRNLENEIYKRVAMHAAKLKRRLPPVLAAVWAERYCESEDDRPP
ncbi:unnamed protein product [Pelagomonas calceolata]|uniref:Uncharacterized protein n=1 Tax=Pelagomonas calceolata TaxID=35677 RepID=A0A8J2SMV8_9STRA|nr:unnamed protein product [Pelagomonas calceolata]